jgi:predicted nuclease of predicted toxin-antitoxin system
VHFLIDANLPRSLTERLASLGQEGTHVRDIGLGDADDAIIAAHARSQRLTLITREWDFGDVRNYPPQDYQGIVVIDLPSETIARTIIRVIENFVRQAEMIRRLPGHLAIVEAGSVRFR